MPILNDMKKHMRKRQKIYLIVPYVPKPLLMTQTVKRMSRPIKAENANTVQRYSLEKKIV